MEKEVLCSELKAIKEPTKPQVFDPPRKMYVWDAGYRCPSVRLVVAILPNCDAGERIITSNGYGWAYCCEIPEEPNHRRATNREVSKWLAQGNGELIENSGFVVQYGKNYPLGKENDPLENNIKVRKWEDTGWHEPTIDYLGIKEG